MLRTLGLVVAGGLVLALCACTPTYPDGELLPIFDETATTDDALPSFINVQNVREGSARHLGSDERGIEYYVALADLMGTPVSTCLVSIESEELWVAACTPNLPLTSSLEGYGDATLQSADAAEPDGAYEKITDNLWVQITD